MLNDLKSKLKSACYFSDIKIGSFVDFFTLVSEDGKNIDLDKRPKYQQEILLDSFGALNSKLQDNVFFNNIKKFDNGDYIEHYKKLLDTANEIFDINIQIPLILKDILPEPFESRGCDSVSVDLEDSIRLNIENGIYYKKQFLTYGYYEFVIAHEIIHQVISFFSNEYFPYTALIEDGFCDCFAAILLYKSQLFDEKTISNFFLYNRELKHQDCIWGYYNKAFRIVLSYISDFGIKNAIATIKLGRKTFKTFDKNLRSSCENIDKLSILSHLKELPLYYVLPLDEYYILSQYPNIKEEEFYQTILSLNNKGLISIEQDNIYISDKSFFKYMRYEL